MGLVQSSCPRGVAENWFTKEVLGAFCHGGWKIGGGKPHEGHLPKTGWTPLRLVRFPPPRVSVFCFFVQESTMEQTRSLSFGAPEISGGRSLVRFLPPTFSTPPYHGPIFMILKFPRKTGKTESSPNFFGPDLEND